MRVLYAYYLRVRGIFRLPKTTSWHNGLEPWPPNTRVSSHDNFKSVASQLPKQKKTHYNNITSASKPSSKWDAESSLKKQLLQACTPPQAIQSNSIAKPK